MPDNLNDTGYEALDTGAEEEKSQFEGVEQMKEVVKKGRGVRRTLDEARAHNKAKAEKADVKVKEYGVPEGEPDKPVPSKTEAKFQRHLVDIGTEFRVARAYWEQARKLFYGFRE